MPASAQAAKRLEASKERTSKRASFVAGEGSKGAPRPSPALSPEKQKTRKKLSKSGTGKNMFAGSTKVLPGGRSKIKIAGGILKLGDPVWVRDDDKSSPDVYLRTLLTSITDAGDKCTLTGSDGSSITKTVSEMIPANSSDDTPGDHTGLIHLNEPSILHNSKLRFVKDEIYTFTGRILVALNPFKMISGLYGPESMAKYAKQDPSKTGPHVFAVAERAYVQMLKSKKDQSICMSGESGAGKTETNKQLMMFLAKRAAKDGNVEAISDAILKSNPITEAFGNAKTSRNNNSSRFGKFIKVHFSEFGAVAGAQIRTYLLERSRVSAVSKGERSYHIFYQLLVGATAEMRTSLKLGKLGPADFSLLRQSGCIDVPSINDKEDYETISDAFLACGVDKADRAELFAIVAGLLHLGNVHFKDGGDGYAVVAKDAEGALAASTALFGTTFDEALITQVVTINKDSSFTKKLNAKGATEARDAMGRTIFVRLFDWLVMKVNGFVGGGGKALAGMRYIGLLDIFGFERFENNSFEQLCINFTNEKLQQFFLGCVFKTEEEIHKLQGVRWKPVEFQDNQGCIDLIEKNPNGILRILDTQCKMPGSSDAKFMEAVNQAHKASDFTTPVQKAKKRANEAFVVNHFAGKVCYDCKNGSWLEKNNDTLPVALQGQLETAKLNLLATICGGGRKSQAEGSGANAARNTGAHKAKKSATFNSIGRRFIGELATLIHDLASTSSHFVRCIKPNSVLKPSVFEARMVLEQLRCGGVFDAVEVMKSSFPTRIPYIDIYGKYAKLLPAELVGQLPEGPFCEVVALALDVHHSDYALGTTMLFLKAGKGVFLEELLSMDMKLVIPLLTKKIQEYQVRKKAATLIARHVRGWWERLKYKRLRRAASAAQRAWRGKRARNKLAQLRRAQDAKVKSAAAAAAKDQSSAAAAAAEAERVKVAEQREAAQRLAQRQALQEAEKAKVAEESRRKDAEMALERLKEQLATQKQHIVELQQAAKSATEAQKALVESQQENQKLHAEIQELKLKLAHAGQGGGTSSAELAKAKEEAQEQKAMAEQYAAELKGERKIAEELEAKLANAMAEMHDMSQGLLLEGTSLAGFGARPDRATPSMLGAEASTVLDNGDVRVTVRVPRDEETGTMGVDIDEWEGFVTVGVISPDAPAVGKLEVGDVIEGVGGKDCHSDMNEVIRAIIESPEVVILQVRRPLRVTVLTSNMSIQTQGSSDWFDLEVSLLQSRQLLFKDEDGAAAGEINLRSVVQLELGEALDGSCAELCLSTTGDTYLMRTADRGQALLNAWYEEMQKMVSSMNDANNNKEQASMVWQQGYLEMSVGLDEWAPRFFMLSNTNGLIIYLDQQKRRNNIPEATLPLSLIRRATRSTGLDHFENGITIHLENDEKAPNDMNLEMVEARCPNRNEMHRWLSTLNMHCTAPHTQGGLGLGGKTPSGHAGKPAGGASGAGGAAAAGGNKAGGAESSTGKGERRRSVVPATAQVAEAGLKKELRAGWLSVALDKKGLKKRFCRLVTATVADGKGAVHQRATLWVCGKDSEAAEAGEPLQLWTATKLDKEEDKKKKKKPGPVKVAMTMTMPGKVVQFLAEDKGGDEWVALLREHLGKSDKVGVEVGAQDPLPLASPLPDHKRSALINFVPPTEPPLREAWLELADFSTLAQAERTGLTPEDVAFNMVYVVLWPSRVLAYFETDDVHQPPLGVQTITGAGPSARILVDAPYNYEHAFAMPPPAAELTKVATEACVNAWWLCPDTDIDTDEWLASLNGTAATPTGA